MDIYSEAKTRFQIIMSGYRKFLVSPDTYDYKGFHMEDNNFYVFFDVSKSWVNYHYLNINETFWTVMISEITESKNVCGINISNDIQNFFSRHNELSSLYDYDGNTYDIPRPAYSLELKKNMDWILTFGKSSEVNQTLKGEYFHFMNNYNDCTRSINDEDDLKTLVIHRYGIFYNNLKIIHNNVNTLDSLDDEDNNTSYIVVDDMGRNVLAIKDYYSQKSISAHNTVIQ